MQKRVFPKLKLRTQFTVLNLRTCGQKPVYYQLSHGVFFIAYLLRIILDTVVRELWRSRPQEGVQQTHHSVSLITEKGIFHTFHKERKHFLWSSSSPSQLEDTSISILCLKIQLLSSDNGIISVYVKLT